MLDKIDPTSIGLAPDEQIVWSGRPIRGPRLNVGDMPPIAIGLLAALMVIDVSLSALGLVPMSGAQSARNVVPELGIGVAVVIAGPGIWLKRRLRWHRTTYVLTSRHVCRVIGNSVRRYSLVGVQGTNVVANEDGSGTIRFNVKPFASVGGGGNWENTVEGGGDWGGVAFAEIREVRRVEALVDSVLRPFRADPPRERL